MKVFVGVVLCALALAGCGGGGGGGGNTDDGNGPYGLDARVAPSGVQIPVALVGGSSQVSAVDAFPALRPQGQTFMTSARDGTNRLFVTDRNGVIQVFENRSDVTQIGVFMDISGRVDDSTGENGMLGLVFDPAFSSNRRFYVSYVYVPDSSNPNPNARTVRLSRFTANAGGTAGDPASERVIFEYSHPEGSHFGGWIGFGPEPDGRTLYLSTGDGENPSNVVQNNASPYGKVLRLRLSSDGSSYTVPSDNPFGSGNPVWAMGFRNPWRCSFDRGGNRELWCGDVGNSNYEEVNIVRAGRNYGWPYCEGSQVFEAGGQACSTYEQPVYYYPHSVGVAVIGGYVYRGNSIPQLQGRYLYTDFATNTIWSLQPDGTNEVVADGYANGQTYAMGEDDNGEVYALAGNGAMYRVQLTGGGAGATNPTMPATLSATGLFTDLAQLTPAPGMIDYELNSPLWSDGAQKRRWVIVPDSQSVGFAASGAWNFPVGTITVKHFELPLAGGGTTRLETRVMVRRTNGWTGYTYRWRGDQSDADLLTSGASATYNTVNPATGAATTLTWNFPSQAQCMNCHTEVTGRVLGLNTRQFNRSHSYAATGRSDNQLRTLSHIGWFSSNIGDAAQYDAMPNPSDASVSFEARAKAYLDSNCSICHQPGGPTPVSNMDLRFNTAASGMGLLGVAATQSAGVRVTPGNPAASVLWQRVSSTGSNRMPPLGVQMVDAEAVQLLSGWITGLP